MTDENMGTVIYRLDTLEKKVDDIDGKIDKYSEIFTSDALQEQLLNSLSEKIELHIHNSSKQMDEIKSGFNSTIKELKKGFDDTVNQISIRVDGLENRVLALEEAPLKKGNERWKYIVDYIVKGLIGLAITGLALVLGLKGVKI